MRATPFASTSDQYARARGHWLYVPWGVFVKTTQDGGAPIPHYWGIKAVRPDDPVLELLHGGRLRQTRNVGLKLLYANGVVQKTRDTGVPVFIELASFNKRRQDLLDDESFRQLQNALLRNETRIDPIPGTGGLLKARWGGQGKGKRGGVRVIYYHKKAADIYLLLLIYAKSEADDLTPDQAKALRELVRRELG